MPVINQLERYKTYVTERVQGKDGIIRPITKVVYIKPCVLCGSDMLLISHKKGGTYKRSITRWWCQDRICGHSEIEETSQEFLKRKIQENDDKIKNK